MQSITQYTDKQLQGLNTHKLGHIYIDLFRNMSNIDSANRLERLTEILFSRPDVTAKAVTLNQIKYLKKQAVLKEEYERAADLRDMQDYYEKHIMG